MLTLLLCVFVALLIVGVPIGFALIILVSLVTPAPRKDIQDLIDHVRYPTLRDDINTNAA